MPLPKEDQQERNYRPEYSYDIIFKLASNINIRVRVRVHDLQTRGTRLTDPNMPAQKYRMKKATDPISRSTYQISNFRSLQGFK